MKYCVYFFTFLLFLQAYSKQNSSIIQLIVLYLFDIDNKEYDTIFVYTVHVLRNPTNIWSMISTQSWRQYIFLDELLMKSFYYESNNLLKIC